MKRIGVVANEQRDIGYKHTKVIVEKLLEKGFEVFVTPEAKEAIQLSVRTDPIFDASDLIICVGGDGTFLQNARKAYFKKKPVLGINKGTVGFLAEVETKDIEKAVNKLAEGDFKIQPRLVLHVEVIRCGERVYEDIAINDAVVTRAALSRILRLQVMLDEKYVDSFPSDGIIVSTPTGSTGYSLSAGGPIVPPDMRLMLITPICPHILYSRSFLAPESRTVKISMENCCEADAMVTVDGQAGFALEQGDLVCVSANRNDVLFASVTEVNFYEVLRAKIHQ
ncbi:MAG TPA: NAD(+) kinase [Ruminiclostridium sp.]|nr:NAD(+) kinase [Ruminiclostridium sp.]